MLDENTTQLEFEARILDANSEPIAGARLTFSLPVTNVWKHQLQHVMSWANPVAPQASSSLSDGDLITLGLVLAKSTALGCFVMARTT